MKKDGDIFFDTEQLKEGLSNSADETGVEDVLEELTRAGPGTSLNDDLRKFRWITTMLDHVVKELGPSIKDNLTELSGNAEWIITKLNNLEGAVLIMNRSLDEIDRRTINLSKEFKSYTDKLTKGISQEIQRTIAQEIQRTIAQEIQRTIAQEIQRTIAPGNRLEEKLDSFQTRISSLETVMNDQHQVEGKSKKKQKQKKKPVKEQNDTQKVVGEKKPDKDQNDTLGVVGEKTTGIGDDCLGSEKGSDNDYANWSNAKKRRMRKLKVKRRNEENAKQEGKGNDKQPEKGVEREQEVKHEQQEVENEQGVERKLEKENKLEVEHVKAEAKHQHEKDHKEEVDNVQDAEHKQNVEQAQEVKHEKEVELEEEVENEEKEEHEHQVINEQEIEHEKEVEHGQNEQEVVDDQVLELEKGERPEQGVEQAVAYNQEDTEPMVQNSAYNSSVNEASNEKGNRKDQDEEKLKKEQIDWCSLFNLQTDQTKYVRREQNGRWRSLKYHLLDVLDDRGPVPFPASFTTFFALLSFACVYLTLTVYACLPDNP